MAMAAADARSVLDARPLHENTYFRLLANGATPAWFRMTQEPFVHAVAAWRDVLQHLLHKLPRHARRDVVLQNLADEHGNGDDSRSHVSTFMAFLRGMGCRETSYRAVPTAPCVTDFVTALLGMEGDWVRAVAAVGMIEYGYAFVSSALAEYCAKHAIPQQHYGEHRELDLEHADELFALLPVGEQHADVRSGMAFGWQCMTALYESLADVRDNRVMFASVMEDSRIERSLLAEYSDPRVLMVGSGGCTLLDVLSMDTPPAEICVVDTNPDQVALIRLKLAAVGLEPARFAALLRGGLSDDEITHLLSLLTDARDREFWDALRHHIADGIAHMGCYDQVFRKLSLVGYQAAFDAVSLQRQFGPAVTAHAKSDLAGAFEHIMRTNSRTPYFQGLIAGDAPLPPYASALAAIRRNMERARVWTRDLADVASSRKWHLIQTSNVTDWMPRERVDDLLSACKAALTDDGVLLMRRINGAFELDDLTPYGLEAVQDFDDGSGLYAQTRAFRRAKLPARDALRAFETRLDAQYPLGQDRFSVRHDPARFYGRLGDVVYKAEHDADGHIISTCAAVYRRDLGAWYVGDLKVAEEHRGSRLAWRMMSGAMAACSKRSTAVFAVAMGDADRIPRLMQTCLPRVAVRTARLNVYMLPEWHPCVLAKYGPDDTALVSLRGVKDIVLASTGAAADLLHVCQKSRALRGDDVLASPRAGALYCVCAVAGSSLDEELLATGTAPSSAQIVSANMEDADWNLLSTAEI